MIEREIRPTDSVGADEADDAAEPVRDHVSDTCSASVPRITANGLPFGPRKIFWATPPGSTWDAIPSSECPICSPWAHVNRYCPGLTPAYLH